MILWSAVPMTLTGVRNHCSKRVAKGKSHNQFTRHRGKENVHSLQELDMNQRSLMKYIKISLHSWNLFCPWWNTWPTADGQVLSKELCGWSSAWLVPVPNMASFFLPRLAPCNFGLGWQQHVETHSLVLSNPLEYLASVLDLCNVHWAPCCCWTYLLLTKLPLSISEAKFMWVFYVFPTISPICLSAVSQIPVQLPLVVPIRYFIDLLSISGHGHDFHWKTRHYKHIPKCWIQVR